MIVVIPTARDVALTHLEPLLDRGVRILVVDDADRELRVDHPDVEVLALAERRRRLGPKHVAIPHGNGACRDFGLWVAWKEGEPDEVVVALDDDCIVRDEDFVEQVDAALSEAARPVATVNGTHLNCLDLYADIEPGLFPRGFPYSARPGYERCSFETECRAAPSFNLGLWQNVFDINALDKLAGPPYVHPEARLRMPSATVDSGRLVSVCSMNMHCRREVLPALYQLPMAVEVLPGLPIDRYGDIWGGFILKTLMDLRGDVLAFGGPLIFHSKEGDHLRNIRQEHLAHLVNDEFLALLESITGDIRSGPNRSYVDMLGEVHDGLAKRQEKASSILAAYLQHLTPALRAWVEAL